MGGGKGGLGATTETTKEGGGGRGGVKGGRGGKGSRGLRKKGGEQHEAWESPMVSHAVLDVLRILPLQFVYKGADSCLRLQLQWREGFWIRRDIGS